MTLADFPPGQVLSKYVRVYRVVHFSFDQADKIPPKPYPPRPEHCLSFYPRDTETIQYADNDTRIKGHKSVIIGQHEVVNKRYVGNDFLVIQVVFQPGALYQITGIPSAEITNAYIDAEVIFSNTIRLVNRKLNDAESISQMLLIIEAFLTTLVNNRKTESHRVDDLSAMILQSKKNCSMDWLAKESCLSLRQFERKFMERMGIGPKSYCRIVRFENAFRMKNMHPNADWLTIAIHCGYHDYQHLVKDYKEFTGQTPTQFHLLDLKAPERKFGEADTY